MHSPTDIAAPPAAHPLPRSRSTLRSALRYGFTFIVLYYLVYAALFAIRTPKPLYTSVQQGALIVPNHLSGSWASFDRAQQYDAILLGSSHALHGIDSRIFSAAGHQVFNLGSPNQALATSYEAARSLTAQTKAFIVEIFPGTATDNGEYALRDFITASDDYAMLARMAWRTQTLRAWQHLSVKPLADTLWRDLPRSFTDNHHGFYPVEGHAPANAKYTRWSTIEREEADRALRLVDKLIAHCAQQQRALAFVYVPVPHAAKRGKGETSFLKRVTDKCSAAQVPFWDLSADHPLDDHQHFYDTNHLNAEGAAWTAKAILERIKTASTTAGPWQKASW